MEELLKALLDVYIPVLNANCKKTFAFLDEYVPPPTRKERRKREGELKKKFPLDLTKQSLRIVAPTSTFVLMSNRFLPRILSWCHFGTTCVSPTALLGETTFVLNDDSLLITAVNKDFEIFTDVACL